MNLVSIGSCMVVLALTSLVACAPPLGEGAQCNTPRVNQSGVRFARQPDDIDSVDILFEIDNSGSMRENQAQLSTQFRVLIDQLVSPPLDPMTMRPRYRPVKSMHVGVISSDLGTPGSTIPSCSNSSDLGDDGLLNPIRQGQNLRSHQPWTTAPERRPMRCTTDPNQYPTFLTFTANMTDADVFREDFVCNAFLSTGGCGLEQQLEAVYRALVVHNPREQAGNTDPNAGFVRPNAVLAIVIVSDEEDGSTRDCRFAERDAMGRPLPCQDATTVFESTSSDWATMDLNLRFYMYQPGSPQDPTWPIERYIDPTRPNRGFLSLKPGHPDQVIFAAIAGVPINLPLRGMGPDIDWDTLLGRNPDGSDGFTGMSNEGPVSMRQRNMDPECTTRPRVVPACRREGTSYDPMRPPCDSNEQYFATPSRRIVQVARRFADSYQNGTVSSICKTNYADALRQIVERIQSRFGGRCLPRALSVNSRPTCCDDNGRPLGCTISPSCMTPGAVSVQCEIKESLPPNINRLEWCVPSHGRRFVGRENGQDVCVVSQLAVPPGQRAPADSHGFFYDTTVDPSAPHCTQRISFTTNDSPPTGTVAVIDCVQAQSSTPPTPQSAPCGSRGFGEACSPLRPNGAMTCSPTAASSGCFDGREVYLETGNPECRSGTCLTYNYSEASSRDEATRLQRQFCTCRCGVPESRRGQVDPRSLCTCPTGFSCLPIAGERYPAGVQGSYCVRRTLLISSTGP